MKHLGNISKINVDNVESVDCVIGGSPCQDLSIAGKRAGLDGERSGLFMEQIRICREMRESDKARGKTGIDVRPRFCVWENVPGALSSHSGEDFRIVLEEFCKVADPNASVPRPANGKWSNSGCIMGDNYSVAWRIMDARYNGVPQRRRRISLVADFAGQSAPKILFDEEGMRWDFEASQEAWKRASDHAEHCSVGSSGEGLGDGTVAIIDGIGGQIERALVGESAPTIKETHYKSAPCVALKCGGFVGRQGAGSGSTAYQENVAPTLRGNITADIVYVIEGNGQRPSHQGNGWSEEQVGYTLNSVERHGVAYAIDGNVCDRASAKNGCGYSKNVSPTLNTQDKHAVVYEIGEARLRTPGEYKELCPTLTSRCGTGGNNVPEVVYDARGNEELSATLQAKPNGGFSYNCINPVCYEAHRFGEYREGVGTLRASGGDCGNGSETLAASFYPDTTGALCANSHPGSYTGQDAFNDMLPVVKRDQKYIVRRLTPLECSRLQGLQDDWCVVPPQESVSDEDLTFWKPFWDEWMQINGKKPKTENQITKWLMGEVSESAQYQMYGNGIAVSQWFWVCGRIIETYGEKKPTMASLFDGTGSFP